MDEVGFGTSSLRKYSYALIGKPAVLWSKKLPKNITCCATISENGVELVRFFVGGGTKNEVFEDYLKLLLPNLLQKYPQKKLVIILDNLKAHKCSLILKIMGNY